MARKAAMAAMPAVGMPSQRCQERTQASVPVWPAGQGVAPAQERGHGRQQRGDAQAQDRGLRGARQASPQTKKLNGSGDEEQGNREVDNNRVEFAGKEPPVLEGG